jgi:hypothetical protein
MCSGCELSAKSWQTGSIVRGRGGCTISGGSPAPFFHEFFGVRFIIKHFHSVTGRSRSPNVVSQWLDELGIWRQNSPAVCQRTPEIFDG